jgi:hypothetical protein
LRLGGLGSGGLSRRFASTLWLFSWRDIRFNWNSSSSGGLDTTLRETLVNGAQEGQDVGKSLVVSRHG